MPSVFIVHWCRMSDKPSRWDRPGFNGWGWRVGVRSRTRRVAIPMKFARPKDAEMAMRGLIREGIRTLKDVEDAGPERVYRIMCEALQW